MPSFNPFKRRKSSKAKQAAAEHPASPALGHGSIRSEPSRQLASPGERPASPAASSSSSSSSSSAQHGQTRMYNMGRRAPFGVNVKYKAPPQHASPPPPSDPPSVEDYHARGTPPIHPLATHHEPEEMTFADEPVHRQERREASHARGTPPIHPLTTHHEPEQMIFADEPAHHQERREASPAPMSPAPMSPASMVPGPPPTKPPKRRWGIFGLFRRKSKKAPKDDMASDVGSREFATPPRGSPTARNRLAKKKGVRFSLS